MSGGIELTRIMRNEFSVIKRDARGNDVLDVEM